MKAKWLLWCMWVVAVLFIAAQPAKCEEIKELKNLHYSYSTPTYNGSVIYDLTCYDECTVWIKPMGRPYEEAVTYPISDEQVKEIIDVLNKYEVWTWDGFNEYDPDAMDGNSFSFSLTMQDGITIEAEGYMMFPEHFGDIIPELCRIFDSLEDNGEGRNGILIPVIIGSTAFIAVLVIFGVVRKNKKRKL